LTRARDVANVLSTATSLATDTETAAAISSHATAANGHVGRGTTANRPASPTTGDLYYDTTINNLIRYNGTSWIEDGMASPGYKSGLNYTFTYSSVQGVTMVNQRTYYLPIYIPQTLKINRLWIRSGSSFSGNAVIRLGIYNNNPLTGEPSTVFIDGGTVGVSASNTVYTVTIDKTFSANTWYFLAANSQTSATTNSYNGTATYFQFPTLHTPTGINRIFGFTEDSISGDFTTAGSLSSNTNPVPVVGFRAF